MNKKTSLGRTMRILCAIIVSVLCGLTSANAITKVNNQKDDPKKKRTIIIYYSYTNHTKIVAERIQKATGYEIAVLELVKPYPSDYKVLEELAKKEAEEEFVAEIKPLNIDLSKYDTIILGTPVWWYTFTPAIRAFLTKNDLSNKIIIPYATNAGWLGHTFDDIKKLCPKSVIKDELSIKFSGEAKENKILTPNKEIEDWIKKL